MARTDDGFDPDAPSADQAAASGGADYVPPRRVVVGFVEGMDLPYEEGAESALVQPDADYWARLVATYNGIHLVPVFSLDPAVLDDLMQRAAKPAQVHDGDRIQPSLAYTTNLRRWFFVDGPSDVDFDDLARKLAKWPSRVAVAYVAGRVRPATDEPRQGDQHSLNPATRGIDADYARTQLAGRGELQRMIDIESNWMVQDDGGGMWSLTHEDLRGVTLDPPAPQGVLEDDDERRKHGTAVLGIVCAKQNDTGILGIAPDIASVGLVSYKWARTDGTVADNIPKAIATAASFLGFGDTLLIEAEVSDATTGLYHPAEFEAATYEAVRLATALGIVVVEAGGNGNSDGLAVALDGVRDAGGFQIFDRDVRDSLAIMVSAASTQPSGGTYIHKRLDYAPYGDRIDCYAWGQVILSCTLPAVGEEPYANFNKTSGASAIVAGAALVVQSHVQARYGMRLGPAEMRYLLHTYGTDPTARGDSTDPPRIGRMPDLKRIFEHLADALPGLPIVFMRDFLGDDGGENTTGDLWKSPDIIVRASALVAPATPDSAFGEPSGHADDGDLSTLAISGRVNRVFVRARNRGGVDATDVRVRIFWSRPTTLMRPSMWRSNEIGTAHLPLVRTGGALAVSDPIDWTPNLPSGHFCMVAMLAVGMDPPDPPAEFGTMDNFEAFVGRNRDVVWRNIGVVNVLPALAAPILLPFIAPGAGVDEAPMALVIEATLPAGSGLGLAAPADFLAAAALTPASVVRARTGEAFLQLPPGRKTRLRPYTFPADAYLKMTLAVQLPKGISCKGSQITVRQTWQGRTLGGMTWRFVPAVPEVVPPA